MIAAAKAIEEAVGAPDVLVHNAGIAAAGCAEDMPLEAWERLFRTNLFGPVQLTKELLPSMRAAGRGRIVVVSSQGGIRGHAVGQRLLRLEGSARAVGRIPGGGDRAVRPGRHHSRIGNVQDRHHHRADAPLRGPERARTPSITRASIAKGRAAVDRLANPPERFAAALAKVLDERAPFARHAVGLDAHMLLFGNRLLPGRLLHHLISRRDGPSAPRRAARRQQ